MSMNIEKLGPIKEAEIKLNKLNLFVGEMVQEKQLHHMLFTHL